MEIAVIGGGASGIMAALNAAWSGASVTLFERNA
ncbi:MAG: NAD(P)/FAD-dependent oxidoreductase, partial [Chloroflexota bacterium]|nr:NAD(P)/FAD-dependent oxidoreductase [Chloroflexota bacterium]MDY6847401.1 NAD(P)/FAD-dependent oxidoreductase [Chloroflexota bacterium]